MERLEFKKIHNVIIDFLKEESNTELEIIGSWYFRFLRSDRQKLSLYLPFYKSEFTELAFNYVRTFTVVFNLIKQESCVNFNGTCLFDIFNKSSWAKMDELTLDFIKQKENLALWGEDTITKLDTFLPVFNKEEILEFNKSKTIKNTFELFKSLRNSNFFDVPLHIELEEKTLTFNHLEDIGNEFISENLFLLNTRLSRKEAIKIYKELSIDFTNCNYIKYPYSLKPTFPLTEIGKKKFNLIFNNRFAYNEILENDIFLLKDETKLSNHIKYNIIDTDHSKYLYGLFKKFKENWTSLELNKYTTPFPKYWFLFLNPSLTKEAWLTQFKIDFPAVAENPIIKIVEEIIKEIIGLNWIEKELTNSPKILFPELKSLRKKRLEYVFNNFKNYVSTLNANVEFIDAFGANNYENVIVLDGFNVIDLVNKNQCHIEGEINVMVPDYLYFGYQPWIKFHLFNYQFSPLISGSRLELDDNFFSNKEDIENLREKIIKEIKFDLKKYNEKYAEETKEDEFVIETEENPVFEDLEYTNDEEIEDTDSLSENDLSIIINQNLENEVTILATEKVLLQKDTLIYIKASALKECDFFIRNSDISELYNSNVLYDKLVNIPEVVLRYQNDLFRIENVFKTLKTKGISYQHQSYFENTYLLKEFNKSLFRVPRRKKNWSIICEFLNISRSDQKLAFVAYYGREKQNELKQMYKIIIDLLIENNWLGIIEAPVVETKVSEIIKAYNHIFNITDTDEIKEISESIISTILDQLSFTEIKNIKTIANE